MGSIRSPAALPWRAVRGRAFLSEHADDKRFRYDKGGLAEGVTHRQARGREQNGGLRVANPPYGLRGFPSSGARKLLINHERYVLTLTNLERKAVTDKKRRLNSYLHATEYRPVRFNRAIDETKDRFKRAEIRGGAGV